MSAIRTLVSWGIVTLLGCGVGLFLCRFPADMHSVVLTALGTLSALATAFSFQAIRKFDDLKNAAYLDPVRLARLRRKLDRRRASFHWKWGVAVVLGIIVAIVGQVLKVPSLFAHAVWFITTGYGAISVMLFLDFLLIKEFSTLSRLGSDLSKISEDESRKTEFLRKVRA